MRCGYAILLAAYFYNAVKHVTDTNTQENRGYPPSEPPCYTLCVCGYAFRWILIFPQADF